MRKPASFAENSDPLAIRQAALPYIIKESNKLLRNFVEGYYNTCFPPADPNDQQLVTYGMMGSQDVEDALMKVFFGGYILERATAGRHFHPQEASARNLIISSHKDIAPPSNIFTANFGHIADTDNPYIKMTESIRCENGLASLEQTDGALTAARALTGKVYLSDPFFQSWIEDGVSSKRIHQFMAVQ